MCRAVPRDAGFSGGHSSSGTKNARPGWDSFMQCAARQRPTELTMINNPKCAGPTLQHVGRNRRSALRRSCLAKFVEFTRLVFRNKVGSPHRDETMITNLARACATSAARRRNALRLLRPTAVAYDRRHPRPPAFRQGLLGGEAIEQPVAARAAQVGLAAAAVGAARGMR